MGVGNVQFQLQQLDLSTFSNTALINTDLSLDFAANKKVYGRFWCPIVMGAAGSGIRMQLTCSSAPTVYGLTAQFYEPNTNVVDQWALAAQAQFSYAYPGGLGFNFIMGNFYLQTNLATNVRIQFAQLVSNPLALILAQGSCIETVNAS